MDTSRADMTQAVLEGVSFAVRDMYECAKRASSTSSSSGEGKGERNSGNSGEENRTQQNSGERGSGEGILSTMICGGGAKSPLWRKMIAIV